jgi:leucyl-tRNA synthetase/predicted alpha/beta hydrolase family esterase
MPYNHQEIEPKWQKRFEESGVFHAQDGSEKDPFYCLVEFPYPSGDGLHVGHPRSYTALDVIARKRRMEGFNVLYPMGWDAFGLPTENFAIKTGRKPQEVTAENVATFKRQLKALGMSFDWEREINTTDPAYYKWTQWMFLELFKAGLAYKDTIAINWCLSCKIGLANEEVVNGSCERCGGEVEKRDKEQWMIAITKYGDKLLEGLKDVDYLPQIKKQQENWIGRSEGAEVMFKIDGHEDDITVFTTRPDTLFGATYMVLAPEHALVQKIVTDEQRAAVEAYVTEAGKKTDIERGAEDKEKTGVFTGCYAINPVNDEKIPIWVADYVMMGYGTGAIMAVPAHDSRDFAFAKKFELPIREVVLPSVIDENNPPVEGKKAVERTMVQAIIHNPRTDKYLNLAWKEHPWMTFVLGGVDKGEDLIEAAKREVLEETGYTDLEVKRVLGGPIRAEYFAAHKDENRVAYATAIHFELTSDNQEPISDEEQAKHELVWVDRKDLNRERMSCSEIVYWLDRLEDPSADAYCGEGVNINSDFLDGLETKEAKEKITSWLEEKGLGKAAVNFKLRDWVFSRQRYWGEPIPLVHCEKCAKKKKQKVYLFHGWMDNSQSGCFVNLKQNLESKGYEVFAFDAPNTDEPVFEEWLSFAKEKIEEHGVENISIVGHSMGGHLALKLCEEYEVDQLALLAPVGFSPSDGYFGQFEESLDEGELEIFKKYQNHDLDIQKVKENVGKVDFVFGEKDPWITSEIVDYYKKNFSDIAKIQIIEGAGHLSQDEGVNKVSQLENIFNKQAECGWVPVPVEELPLTLPDVEKYEPTDNGDSPLAAIEDWVNTTCPACGGEAKRETDTMPNWAGSSWYFLRYIDPKNDDVFADPEKLKYWMPVNLYNGGMEHVTLHLLYSRFWNQFLHDQGHVPVSEPYQRRTAHGLIMAENGVKMSKSKGNVVNPDEMVAQYGADALRTYILFMGPFDEPVPWSTNGLVGVRRFLEKVNRYVEDWAEGEDCGTIIEPVLKKVGEDIEAMRFNTAVSAMMQMMNELVGKPCTKLQLEKILIMLCPFAPHLANELWERIGNEGLVEAQVWPEVDEAKLVKDVITMAVQVNGKVRAEIEIAPEASEDEAKDAALAAEGVQKYLDGKEIRKVIYVPGRILNIVV